jgi:hypothetical protein
VDLHGRSRHRQRGAVQAGERSGAEPDARQDCEGGSAGEEAPQPSRPGGDLPGSRGSRTVQRPDRRRCRLGGMGASSPRGQLVAHACGVAAGQMGRRQAFRNSAFRNSAFRNSARSSGKLGPARLTLSRTARGRLQEGRRRALAQARSSSPGAARQVLPGAPVCAWPGPTRSRRAIPELPGRCVPVLPLRLLEPLGEPTGSGRPCHFRRFTPAHVCSTQSSDHERMFVVKPRGERLFHERVFAFVSDEA